MTKQEEMEKEIKQLWRMLIFNNFWTLLLTSIIIGLLVGGG